MRKDSLVEQLVQRLLCLDVRIDSHRLRTGHFDDEDWQKITQGMGRLSELPIFIDDTACISVMELRTKARRLYAEFGLDLIIIDYLQLMTGDNRSENRVQEISYLSRALKALARELNVPVLVASQLSRAVEQSSDKKPVLSDLRESGSIEQDADIVMFIYREDVYDENSPRKNIAELLIAKDRKGPTGSIELYFERNLTQFRNALKRDVAL